MGTALDAEAADDGGSQGALLYKPEFPDKGDGGARSEPGRPTLKFLKTMDERGVKRVAARAK